MTQDAKSRDNQSQYLALINTLIETYRDFDSLSAPSDAQNRLLDVINRYRDDYNKRFPTSALLPTADRVA